jgi:hypothetical protein
LQSRYWPINFTFCHRLSSWQQLETQLATAWCRFLFQAIILLHYFTYNFYLPGLSKTGPPNVLNVSGIPPNYCPYITAVVHNYSTGIRNP